MVGKHSALNLIQLTFAEKLSKTGRYSGGDGGVGAWGLGAWRGGGLGAGYLCAITNLRNVELYGKF